jgi:hypothetical protein
MKSNFLQPAIKKFWDEISSTLLDHHREALLIVLVDLDEHRDTSSVYSPPGKNIDLGKIFLFEHSLRVARLILNDGKNSSLNSLMDGCTLLAGLTHDIGKVRERMRPGRLSKMKHLKPSAEWVRNNLSGVLRPKEVEVVAEAVLHHHGTPMPEAKENILARLITADTKAREAEIELLVIVAVAEQRAMIGLPSGARITNTGSEPRYVAEKRRPMPDRNGETRFMSWFDLDKFSERLFWRINGDYAGWLPPAFSTHGDTVYVSPELVFEITKKMAEENDRDYVFMNIAEDQKRRNDVIAYIAHKYQAKGALATELLPKSGNYVFTQFSLMFKGKIRDREGRYMPLHGQKIYSDGQLDLAMMRQSGTALQRLAFVKRFHESWQKQSTGDDL